MIVVCNKVSTFPVLNSDNSVVFEQKIIGEVLSENSDYFVLKELLTICTSKVNSNTVKRTVIKENYGELIRLSKTWKPNEFWYKLF